VNSRAKEVVFRFDEVIAETPRTGPDLRSAIIVSPRDGDPDVSWNHDAIAVKPRHGWRDSMTYVVTLLPGITDLEGNVRDTAAVVVFSTGGAIPDTRIAGAVFDWVRNKTAPRAFIEAFPAGDTTVRYTAESDTSGRFVLPYMRPGPYIVRALIDVDRNKAIDARELWDTARVELRDSVALDMYLYPHDTLAGPLINTVTIVDSLTLRVSIDKPAVARPNYLPEIELRSPDSVLVPIKRFVPWRVIEGEMEQRTIQRRDSVANADTSSARRAARAQARTDSINRAAIIADSLARLPARRPPPVPSRPPLVTEYGVELQAPLAPGTTYKVTMTVVGISGIEKTTQRDLSVPRASPPDSTGGRGGGRGSFR
jgi:hypothetical protein